MRTGDNVHHTPSGENWVVAAVYPENDRMMWCGWPEGYAAISDCTIIAECSDREHREWLERIAKDAQSIRGRYARSLLEAMKGEFRDVS